MCEQERESLDAEVREVTNDLRASTLREEQLQLQCNNLQAQLTGVRDELSSTTGDLGRLIHTMCAPTTGVAGVGMKVKCILHILYIILHITCPIYRVLTTLLPLNILQVKCDDRSGVCTVKAITRGGAADCSGKIAIGDTILSVNDESVTRMTAGEVQDLFHGALGSEAVIEARKNQNSSSQYTLKLIRSLPGVEQRKIPLAEQTLEAIRIGEGGNSQTSTS